MFSKKQNLRSGKADNLTYMGEGNCSLEKQFINLTQFGWGFSTSYMTLGLRTKMDPLPHFFSNKNFKNVVIWTPAHNYCDDVITYPRKLGFAEKHLFVKKQVIVS